MSLKGKGVAGGVVTGEAVCFSSIRADRKLRENLAGKILVLPALDPGWSPDLIRFKGLVTEYGSLLSHSAILCREYGVPSVFGVEEALKKIKTGDRLRLDSLRGTVEILSEKSDK
jgi:pyruvate,water dikinase